jgi:hypothetical protein
VAKRSPILGYNHNVRYRGLVFHVQTEDSGVLSPHLFTHLFYTGVIVSTRKLVYDAGSAEEAIKSLMQAQHKAVLKDLRRGHFDDKIDEYLKDTPGLLPRGTVEDGARPSEPALPGDSEPVTPSAPQVMMPDDASLTRRDLVEPSTAPTLPSVDMAAPKAARTQTAERKSAPSAVRTSLPADPPAIGAAPTELDTSGAVASAIAAANATIPNPIADDEDSGPEIEIQLEVDDYEPPSRRDTDIAALALDDHTRPTVDVSRISDGIPGVVASGSSGAIARPSAVGAATLPPARPITRPPSRPAITPPQVVTRPVTDADRARKTDAVEIYAPAPPSVEPPPGERSVGQYAQHRRSGKVPVIEPRSPSTPIPTIPARDRSGPIPAAPIPSGLGRPGRLPPIPGKARDASSSVPMPIRRPDPTLPIRSRPPTPGRPIAPARTPNASGGVVMTRPAVIVGAPSKPTGARVRKAREDEGRGFGQGLISEKSLDEVILAYLSEDAEDK